MLTDELERPRHHTVARYALVLVLIGLWQLVHLATGDRAVASPAQAGGALLDNLDNWAPDVLETLSALAVAFAIVAVFGVAIGVSLGMSDFWTRTLNPLILVAYSIPKVTLYPIFLLVFGLTMQGRIAFAVLHGILPVIIICVEASRNLPDVYVKVARSCRLSLAQKILQVYVPALRSQVVVALRLGFSLCFLGLLLAEMFASYDGLGARLLHYTSLQQSDQILGVVLLVVFIAFLGTFLFLLWQERLEARTGKVSVRI